ncbi:MAG TPA: hypothetical protein VFI13_03980 [Gemmatimonadales bacterium]|nr:hypothetical protein [Gemmatimonadales bacterium]
MTDPTKDEPVLPERLLDAARAHHAPPPPPREEMWRRIEAARPRRAATPTHLAPRVWVPLAIAATLVAGFGLGRLWPAIHSGVKTQVAARPDSAVPQEDRFTRYAAQQTLGQAEVLLTQYRADTRSGTAAASPAEARKLLVATRLLLDSPSLTDPRLKGLLEDLELVLSQIAEGSAQKEDRAVITEGLDRRDVLPRLRAASPVATGVQLPGAI